jgi:D-alanine-D-alanine ligase
MPSDHATIAILYDRPQPKADADEQERLEVVAAVRTALATLGLTTVPVVLGANPQSCLARLRALRPKAAVNLVEGWRGDPVYEILGPLLCRAAGVPCSGNPAHVLALAGAKTQLKEHLLRRGLPTPSWIRSLGAWRPDDAPYLIKSIEAHGSLGLDRHALVRSPAEAEARLRALRRRHGGSWFLERYVEGREFHVSLLGNPARPHSPPRVLPVAETVFADWPEHEPRIVDYRAKWRPASRAYRKTQRRFLDHPKDAPLRTALAHLGRRVWNTIGLESYARLDIREGRDGRLEIIDVNPNPSLHPQAGFVAAANAAGIDYARLVVTLLPCTASDS